MWRSLRFPIRTSKVSTKPNHQRLYSTPASNGKKGKVILGIIASTGLGFAGAIAYGSYDPKFKSLLENIPYVNNIYSLFPGDSSVNPKDDLVESKGKDVVPSLLKNKKDREKSPIIETPKPIIDPIPKSSISAHIKNETADESKPIKTGRKVEQSSESHPTKKDFVFYENRLNETFEKLKENFEDTINAHRIAANAVKLHTEKIYQALDLAENENDRIWKETNEANLEREKAVKIAKQKAAETKTLIEKVKSSAKELYEQDSKNPLVKRGDIASKYLEDLQKAELQISLAEKEAKTATEYEQLVKASKEQFMKELQIVLPNYLHSDKGKNLTESDLNLLIAHAHRRIEQLQKQIAKQQVTEQMRLEEAVKNQRLQDDQLTESKIQAEMKKRRLDLESALEDRVASLKSKFEADLHEQLIRQTAAHADHLKEVLKVQEQELERKHVLELEEKLLHQKGVFVSEISGNMARLKGILEYLKARSQFDKSSKKAQALWLSCQGLYYKITLDNSGNLSPLAKDIAALKLAADEENDFIDSIIPSIPNEAINRGVFTNEILKQKFEKVKNVCKKVALVDENNDSLYRYFLSYLQSFLIIDTASVSKEELEGKISVDSSEWDTFDILSRISYCLKINDLEQALRYANQLKGEPRVVAKDWMNELKLLLETQLAVKAILAHAAAVGVQAYH